MHSALYTGQLRHRRFAPRAHKFRYRLFMIYIDLAELDEIFSKRWLWSVKHPALAWLRRGDYIGDPKISIDQAVRDRVEQELGVRPTGAIRMLTHLRYFGFAFNPVTIYYCFNREDTHVDTLVTEITNTPWRERHAYVLSSPSQEISGTQRYRFAKTFHVSPFLSMDYEYDWRFSKPQEHLAVHMQNVRDGTKAFDATLTLTRQEITADNLARALSIFPLMTVKVVMAIYWQALRLWLKRIPFYTHPAKLAATTKSSS